ncbi:prenyltransferase [bacterium]|nr:prenyltransferase [bacterium]
MNARFQIWFQQIRGPFLLLAVVLAFIGIAAARYYEPVRFWPCCLIVIGVVQTHIAVNLFNELSDYRTGIDSRTTPTPFSGGSGMMQSGKTNPDTVRHVAYFNCASAAGIGLYFTFVSSPWILTFMIAGGLAIRFYTSFFTRFLMGEFLAGLTLGTGVVLGSFLALTGTMKAPVLLASLPPGILTTQLLFLNEFPDMEADRSGGRNHWVIHLGLRRSACLYCVLNAVLYALIALIPVLTSLPKLCWIALLTLPAGAAACIGARKYYNQPDKLVPFMGLNVIMVLVTDLLLGMGLLAA